MPSHTHTLHIDYYDLDKLKKLPNKTLTVTTLLQASGAAQPGQGFLNVARSSSGDVMFGSGVKDAPLVAKALKFVFAEAHNISVIQISQAIVAPGIGDGAPSSQAAPSPTAKAPSKAPSTSDDSAGKSTPTQAPSGEDGDGNKNKDAAAPTPESGAPLPMVSGRGVVALLVGLVLHAFVNLDFNVM